MTALASIWGDQPRSEFDAELEIGADIHPAQRTRRTERRAVAVAAALRQRGSPGISVQVEDLSVDGFRASTHLDLYPGLEVWLRLPGLEPFHATIMWAEKHYIGCAFERPLHPAVLEMIVRKARGNA